MLFYLLYYGRWVSYSLIFTFPYSYRAIQYAAIYDHFAIPALAQSPNVIGAVAYTFNRESSSFCPSPPATPL